MTALPEVAARAVGPPGALGAGRDGRSVPADDRWRDAVPVPAAEVRSGLWLERLEPEDRTRLDAALAWALGTGRGVVVEARGRREGQCLEVLAMPTFTAVSEGPASLEVAVIDVSDRHERELRLLFDATHDPLTGILNRAALADQLGRVLARRARRPAVLAVLFVDSRDFKAINDHYGHRTGDRVLQAVAERAQQAVRAEDTVARLGGDEFVVVCESLAVPADVGQVAARLAAAISRPVTIDDYGVAIAGTVGVAFAGPSDEGPLALIDRADRAMYVARANAVTRTWSPPVPVTTPSGQARDQAVTLARAAAPVRKRLVATQDELARQWVSAVGKNDPAATARWVAACRGVRQAVAALDGDNLL